MLTIRHEKMKSIDISPLDLISIKDILGCLYYVSTNDIDVVVERLEQRYSVSAKIIDIDNKKGLVTLRVEDGVYFKLREIIKISFVINLMRYSIGTYIDSFGQDGEIKFKIPNVISHDESRGLPRINLPEAMSNCLELVTGLFSGVRIKGSVEDISLGGLSFRPNNIDSVRKSNRIDLKAAKIKAGDRFKKLKFEIDNDVLSIPVEICHTPDEDRDTYGIKYDLTKGKHATKLREFLQSCVPQKKVINFAAFYDKIKEKSEENN